MHRLAIVVSTVGYHWEELFDAARAFEREAIPVDYFTVDGSAPKPDPRSIRHSPLAAVGIGVSSRNAPDSAFGVALRRQLLEVAPVSELQPTRYDALYLPGGHGCLFDVNTNATLHEQISKLHARGAVLSAVCHATSTFAYVRRDGRSIVEGHALTGFPDPLDQSLIKLGLVEDTFLPLPLVNDDVLRAHGAKLGPLDVLAGMFNPKTTRVDLPFITGVGPKAAGPVARAVCEVLAQRSVSLVEPQARPSHPHHEAAPRA